MKNKNIIIVGASQGLGEYCSIEMSKKGANVILIGRSAGELSRVASLCSNKTNNCTVQLDITNPYDCTDKLNSVIDGYDGKIDAILHAAGGGLGFRDPLIKFHDFVKLFETNIIGQSAINNMVIPHMKKNKSGNIVHVSSLASRESIGSVGYNTVKSSINAYVRSLGNELANTGIIVTGVIPGAFIANKNSMERFKKTNLEGYNEYISQMPRGRPAHVSEVYSMIEFLTSKSASMMTGCMVPIDAGEGRAI